jgi:hypothetical protein
MSNNSLIRFPMLPSWNYLLIVHAFLG